MRTNPRIYFCEQTKQNKTKQNQTKQNKTKQNQTKPNQTKQNQTKQIKNGEWSFPFFYEKCILCRLKVKIEI